MLARTLLAALTLLLLAPAVPLGSAGPAAAVACTGECIIPWTGVAFLPPVNVVASGATVVWSSSDPERHVNVEGAALLGQDECFAVYYTPDSPGAATFEIRDGVLYGAGAGEAPKPCTTATFLDTGDAVLVYHCVIHPVTMRGALVVTPAA